MTNEEFTDQIIRAINAREILQHNRIFVSFLQNNSSEKYSYKVKKYTNFIVRFIAKHRNENNDG